MKQGWLALFLGIALFMNIIQPTNACTNFLVTKGASADGSCMITYSADSHSLYGELYYRAAMDYPVGSMLKIYEWDTGKELGVIKQVPHTYSVVGNMNEWQVSIGETTFGGRDELVDTTGILDYGSLIYITLQRARTAREAIKIMTQLVSEYGYCSSGETFSIADANEVWMMDLIGKGGDFMPESEKGKKKPKMYESRGAVWIAWRIPDGYISGHANQARIDTIALKDTMNCYYSADVVSFAKMKGYYNGKDEDFSFVDAYAPLNYGGIRFCDARVWCGFHRVAKGMDNYLPYILNGDLTKKPPLWVKPTNKLKVEDVFRMMRDHYEDTPLDMTKDVGAGPYKLPYRWRPMTWKVDTADHVGYFHERAVSTQQTGFSFIAQSRGWLPNPIGGINWFGLDDTYSTVYVPMYCGITKVPETFKEGNGTLTEFTWNSAFWVFSFVSNFAYLRYSDMIVDIQKVQKELEGQFIQNTAVVDAKAKELWAQDQKKAIQYITDYSTTQGDMVTKRWMKLGEYLLVKYMDGNIKKEKDGKFKLNGTQRPLSAFPKQPPYSNEWYKLIIKETGDRYRMKKLPGEKGGH